MESPVKSQANTRLLVLTGLLVLWGAGILTKLISLQVVHHDEYARIARSQQEHTVDVAAPRGDIFDRNRSTLALSAKARTLFVNPLRVPDVEVAAEMLAPVVSLDRRALRDRHKDAQARNVGFLRLKRRLRPDEYEKLRSLKYGEKGQLIVDWLEFEPESQRHYPKKTVAAHVLGSVDYEEHGDAGIEKAMDRELRGQPGQARMLSDVRGRGFEASVTAEPKAGANLILSIDERIQYVVERELAQAVKDYACRTGSVLVMDPHNGDVLALGSYPTFDPNTRPERTPDAARRNVAVTAPSEPGSVFKVFTVAAGLESGVIRPESVMSCGKLTLGKRVVHEAHHFFGPMPVTRVLEQSSNAGAAQIGMRVGTRRMSEFIRRLGFGSRTGLLPGESPGMLRDAAKWDPFSVAYISFGHEVAVTTAQLAQACSAIANGGVIVRPRVVIRRQRPGGAEEEMPVLKGDRVMRPETTIAMRRMMEGVVLEGTGKAARLKGYTSGGKTGSAQIFEGRDYTHYYNASFMGFAPVTNPALVVVVTLNGARQYGGAVAAPVFQKVMQEALRILDVPKDLPESEPVEIETSGDKTLIAAAPVAAPMPVVAVGAQGPRVPDFRGKSMRDVVEQSSALGIPIVVDGHGTARVQFPAPGTVLPRGGRVRLQFGR